MFEIIKKENDSVIVKMDINTYEWINNEMDEVYLVMNLYLINLLEPLP